MRQLMERITRWVVLGTICGAAFFNADRFLDPDIWLTGLTVAILAWTIAFVIDLIWENKKAYNTPKI